MKRRARRAVIGAAALVAVLLAVLVLWGTVRDHVEGCCFLLSRDTQTLTTDSELERLPRVFKGDGKEDVFSAASIVHTHASHCGVPIVIADNDMMKGVSIRPDEADTRAGILKRNGWRLVELTLPHVIIAYPPPVDWQYE